MKRHIFQVFQYFLIMLNLQIKYVPDEKMFFFCNKVQKCYFLLGKLEAVVGRRKPHMTQFVDSQLI